MRQQSDCGCVVCIMQVLIIMTGYSVANVWLLSWQGAAGMQYRTNQPASDGPQSPTSPLSQPSYSPADSPGISAVAAQQLSLETLQLYQLQQQQQQQQMQTSEMQQQFELINMVGIYV